MCLCFWLEYCCSFLQGKGQPLALRMEAIIKLDHPLHVFFIALKEMQNQDICTK